MGESHAVAVTTDTQRLRIGTRRPSLAVVTDSAAAAPSAPHDDAYPRRWAALSVLVVSLVVVVLDNTVLNVALPTIQRDLDASTEQLVWSVNSYTCVFAAMLFTWGVLGDRYGRKRILLIGLVLFGAASLATAFAQDPMQLIVLRGFMGVGGASVLPVTLAIITVMFPPHERGKAIGFWAAAVGGAVALGPVLGGFLLEHFWWGSVFLINVPIVLVGVVGIVLLVPESRNPNPGRLDPMGALLSFVGLLLLVYGLLHGGDTRDWTDPGVWVPLAAGLGLLLLFLWLEARSDHPSLDLGLFKIPSFASALAAVSLAFAALSGTLLFLTFYLQTLRGYSPLQAGLCILPVALGQVLAAPRSAKMVARFGARRVVSFGLIVVAFVFVGIGQLETETPLWLVLIVFFFLGFGLGNVVAPCTTRMTLAVPPARSGAGSAVQNTVRQVVAALGIAVIASVVATVYASSIEADLAGLPPKAQDAAGDSVQAAYGIAEELAARGQDQAAQALRAAAESSFLSALGAAALISVVLVVSALAIILRFLPAQPDAVAWSAGASGQMTDPRAQGGASPQAPSGSEQVAVTDAASDGPGGPGQRPGAH